MTTLLPVVKARWFTADGKLPLAGGKVDFFEAGTSTRKDTFTDFGGLTANTNPVILDANGEADIWTGTGFYKVVVKDSADVVQTTTDDVSGVGAGDLTLQSVNNIVALKALDAASSDIVEVLGYFNPPGTTVSGVTEQADAGGGLFYWDADSTVADNKGTVIIPDTLPASGRWVRIFDGPVSVKWFGAKGDYILDSGGLNGSPQDDTTEINDTCAFARTHNLAVRIPSGNYFVSGAIVCAVPMSGDQKPRIDTNIEYGDTTWNNGSVNFEGSFIIWDNSLTTTGIHMQNVSGDDSQNVKFKNIAFMSQSSASVGGGILFEIDTPAATTKYDFGDLPPFEDCLILNFTLGIDVQAVTQLRLGDIEFRGCQRALKLGITTTDLAEQVYIEGANFKQCGDGSTSYIRLENAKSIHFNRCLFDVTSEIGILKISGGGLYFSECFYANQASGSGVGGGDFKFILAEATTNYDGGISMYRCLSGTDGGDIDLGPATTDGNFTIIDSNLAGTIDLGTGNLVQFGNNTTGLLTTTGFDNRFTSNDFQYKGLKIRSSGKTRQITTVSADDDEILSLAPTDSSSLDDGALIKLHADLDAAKADIDILAGTGANDGDINLTTALGDINLKTDATKQVKVTNTDDSTSGTTGALISAGGIGSAKDIVTDSDLIAAAAGGGLQIKEGSDARMGTGTLSGGSVVIANTSITANTRVFLTYRNGSAPQLALAEDDASRNPGTSFKVFGNNAEDFSFLLIEPA